MQHLRSLAGRPRITGRTRRAALPVAGGDVVNDFVTDPDLIGSLCNARPVVAAEIGRQLRADDAETVGGQQVLAVVLELLDGDRPCDFTTVQLELMRRGIVDGPAKQTILDAVTAGRCGLESELRTLAELFVSQSLLRAFESWAVAQADAVRTMPPVDLMRWATIQGRAARDHENRRAALAEAVAA